MMEAARRAMHQLDSELALDSLQTMDIQLEQSIVRECTLALLATSFGVLAALMSRSGFVRRAGL
jgi:hypothetical protein